MRDFLIAWVLIGAGLLTMVLLTVGRGRSFDQWQAQHPAYMKNSIWVFFLFAWPVLLASLGYGLYLRAKDSSQNGSEN